MPHLLRTRALHPLLVAAGLLALLPACSVDEERYVSELTTGDCAYALACWDEDVLTQFGWTDQETCEADQGPQNARLPLDCTGYDKKKAKECVKALKERNCADSADRTDLGRPAVCEEVIASCEGGDNSDTDGVEPSDTDA